MSAGRLRGGRPSELSLLAKTIAGKEGDVGDTDMHGAAPSGSGLRRTNMSLGHFVRSFLPTLPRHANIDSSTVSSQPAESTVGMCSLNAVTSVSSVAAALSEGLCAASSETAPPRRCWRRALTAEP